MLLLFALVSLRSSSASNCLLRKPKEKNHPGLCLLLSIWVRIIVDIRTKKKKSSFLLRNHGVWKSQEKSHSTLRAKRATFTFWVDKSSLKMPKMVQFGEFLKTCSLRSNRVTRQVSFNRSKIGEKCQNSFWVIFKYCEIVSFHHQKWKIPKIFFPKKKNLLVVRESGLVKSYALLNVALTNRYHISTKAHKLALNCNST